MRVYIGKILRFGIFVSSRISSGTSIKTLLTVSLLSSKLTKHSKVNYHPHSGWLGFPWKGKTRGP